jgi:hypothetical protein
MTTVFCSKVETAKLITFKKVKGEEFSKLKNIVQFEDADEAEKAAAAEAGYTLRTFKELEDAGRLNKAEHIAPKASDYAVICYT